MPKFQLFLVLSLFFLLNCKKSTIKKSPNIIFLLADDMGYGELGSYGQKIIKTPFLDSLSTQGIKFNNFYTNAVCSPARAALITGKHPGHTTIRGNSGIGENDLWFRIPLKRSELTVGEYLKNYGYTTGIIGKWHLENPDSLYSWAHNKGFDYTFHRQWNKFKANPNDPNTIWENGKPIEIKKLWKKQYKSIDELRTEKAIDFISKNKEQQFFLLMSYKIPHTPENDIYDDEIYKEKGWPEIERQHAGRITLLDSYIKTLFNHIKELGLLENTIFIFTSDNGPHNEGGHNHNFFNSNGNLRGFKRDLYEGGIKVPMITYWKDKITPKVSNHISTIWDVFPTFCDIVDGETPKQIDGISFLPTLLNQKQKKHEYLYWEIQLDGWWQKLQDGGFRQAIRKDNWKAIRYGINNKIELYNLTKDSRESNNVAAKYPDLIKSMDSLFKKSSNENNWFPYGGKIQNYIASKKHQSINQK